jgi:ATP-dependent Clp protease adaptor protein ClpS
METTVIEEFDVDKLLDSVTGKKLIVYNDDVNSFDWVIQSFVEILKHSYTQAEQCAMIIHHKGKCAVKDGTYDELTPYKVMLTNRGLSVGIE